MALRRPRRSSHAPRTVAYRTHEAFGFQVGLFCMTAPGVAQAVQAGIARAMKAHLAATQVRPVSDVGRELLAAGARLLEDEQPAAAEPPAPTRASSRGRRRRRS